ncbi:hypothetical protein F0L68_41055, partial [Solihabitans fulvus]
NRFLLGGIAFELAFAAALVYLPALAQVVGMVPPPAWLLVMLVPYPVIVWGVDELFRRVGRGPGSEGRARPSPGWGRVGR